MSETPANLSSPPTVLVTNERFKLLANTIDRASTGCLVVGILGPVAVGGSVDILIGAVWLTEGAALHAIAQLFLGRLR